MGTVSVKSVTLSSSIWGERLIKVPAESEAPAIEFPLLLTALLAPPSRRLLVPLAVLERTSPVPVLTNQYVSECEVLIGELGGRLRLLEAWAKRERLQRGRGREGRAAFCSKLLNLK